MHGPLCASRHGSQNFSRDLTVPVYERWHMNGPLEKTLRALRRDYPLVYVSVPPPVCVCREDPLEVHRTKVTACSILGHRSSPAGHRDTGAKGCHTRI